jgi:hypothetical protein
MPRIVEQQPDSAGRNLVQVDQYGYPGWRQVGEKSANNFWLLVQHARAHPDFQRQVLRLMLPEGKRKNVASANYAYLTDRVAINANQPEQYSTQVEYAGVGLGKAVPKSLPDPAHVDERRASIGVEPLENYLKIMTQMHVDMNTPKTPNKQPALPQ